MGELEEDRCACDLEEIPSTKTTKSQASEVVHN